MKTLKQRLAILLSVSMILSCMVPAYAAPMDSEEISIEEGMKNETEELPGDSQEPVSYIYYEGEGTNSVAKTATRSDYIIVTSDTTEFEAGKFYVATGTVTINSRIVNNAAISSSAHLILTDGCELHVEGGINNAAGKGLVIYGQTKNSGTLQIDQVDTNNAGIGGGNSQNGGTITINGGTVTATGGDDAAGIGGGSGGTGGTIIIRGGTVNAIVKMGGAGIGSGSGKGLTSGQGYSAGKITISGGTVTALATGSSAGAGIGGGEDVAGGEITISGGIVNATAKGGGAGIGGGHNGPGGTITISGGTVNAYSGIKGAGIGGGICCPGGEITISGGIVTASSRDSGAGIGGGGAFDEKKPGGSGGTIRITGGIVTAIGGKYGAAGIGGGGISTLNHKETGGDGGSITISGGTVTAIAGGTVESGGFEAAGIGGGDKCNNPGTISFTKKPIVLNAGATVSNATPVEASEYRTNHQSYKYTFLDYYATYKVNHRIQKEIDGNDYLLVDTETKYGFPGTLTKATANNYKGYSAQQIDQEEIATDSSTEVDVKYDIIYYTITFNMNGHGTAPNAIKATPGAAIHAPAAPAEEGYAFAGWYRNPDFTEEYSFTTMREENITLYAKWLIVVTLDAQGGSGGTASVSVASYSEMPSIEIPQLEDYAFAGYFTETGGNGKQYYDIHGIPVRIYDSGGPATLHAYWIYSPAPRERFSVSFDSRGGSSVPAQVVASGSTVSVATTSRTGHYFGGWYEDENCSGDAWDFAADKVTKNTMLYAKWTPKEFTITWKDGEGDIVTTTSAAYGELPDYPDESLFDKDGYVHTGWYPAIHIATQSTSYKATYVRKLDGYCIVSFDSQGGSSVPAQVVASGSTVSEPTPDPTRKGYKFEGWKLNDEDFEFATTTIVENITLTASWTAEEYEITWSVNGNISTSTCAYGELPEYSGSTTKDGYVFIGWNPSIQTATANITYTATYYKIEHVHTPQLIQGQPATCLESGYKDCYYCDGCKKYFASPSCASESEIADYNAWKIDNGKISATGHREVNIPQKDATTETDGYQAYWYCPVCRKYFRDNAGQPGEEIGDAAALNVWKAGEGKIDKLPTHAHTYGAVTYIWNDGLSHCTAYRTCTASDCGYTEMETATASESDGKMIATFKNAEFERQEKVKPIPGHEHTFATEWSKDASFHWHAATCIHTDIVSGFTGHSWGSGADKDKCMVCGYEKPAPEPAIKYFTVEFNTDGAKEHINAQRVASGSTATKPSSPSKAGHTFKGWYKEDKLTAFNFGTEKITADTTIYAVWEAIPKAEYTIRWVDYNDSVLKTVQLKEGSLPDYGDTNPSRSGYIFTGWSPKIALVTGDATYRATYEDKSSGGGGGSISGGGSRKTSSNQPAGAVTGLWTYHPDTNKWTFAVGDHNYFDQWAYIYNPNATGTQPTASWFYFDVAGCMMTGWQWIKGSDHITRCYYLNPVSDNTLGACFMGPGTTPDGYTVDENGAWTVNGVVQTR